MPPHLHVYQVRLLHQDRQPGHLVRIYHSYQVRQGLFINVIISGQPQLRQLRQELIIFGLAPFPHFHSLQYETKFWPLIPGTAKKYPKPQKNQEKQK